MSTFQPLIFSKSCIINIISKGIQGANMGSLKQHISGMAIWEGDREGSRSPQER